MSTTELVGGSRIRFILHDIFVKGITSLDPTASLTDDDIRTAIQNSAGARSVLLIPEEPFELLAKQSISKLLDPCKRCAALVHEELLRLVRRCMSAELRRFPMLSRALEEEARTYLAEVRARLTCRSATLTCRDAGCRTGGVHDLQPCVVPAVVHQHERPQLCWRHHRHRAGEPRRLPRGLPAGCLRGYPLRRRRKMCGGAGRKPRPRRGMGARRMGSGLRSR